jgi:hypothetical protein
VLYCRYRVNSGPVGRPSREGVPKWLDIWEEGVYRTAQAGGRAIVAYGLAPRGVRPVESCRLDIRLLGPEAGRIFTGDGPWDGSPQNMEPGETLVIDDGDAWIGVLPLAPENLGHTPPLTLWQDGDETVLSLVNYEGPPKQFWEYRSLGGPFWKGNVRNAFALWIAPYQDFSSREAFAAALAAAPPADETAGSRRTITFGAGPETVRLEYDLRDMWP